MSESKTETKTEPSGPSRRIKVDYLARVEGEGAMYIKLQGDKVEEVKLRIFEPPRFFEAFLQGRKYSEAPDITARICGICPVAYQMSACHAMEEIFGITVDGPLRELRRLIYCGEWIESHTLHTYMLHAPDFLGYEDAIRMAKDHPEVVKRGLLLKKIGNELLASVGGREIHPINVRVGGFYRVPTRKELLAYRDKVDTAIEISHEMIRLMAGFEFPDFTQDYETVALRHDTEYPLNEGRIVSNRGIDIDKSAFYDVFAEEHVAHSNALHCRIKDRGTYLVGPNARYNMNHDRLPEEVRQLAEEVGLETPCLNPFKSIVVRGIETLWSALEAKRIIEDYQEPDAPVVDYEVRAGTGHGCTEAPRGILYHRYTLDADGVITDAKIVPPTSQNQARIEEDLYHYVDQAKHLPDDQLQWRCEQAIRNYDPCISCATHFLDLTVDRS